MATGHIPLAAIALSLALAAPGAPAGQEAPGQSDRVEEHHADGRLLSSCEVRSTEDGVQRHGAYRRWREDGSLAVEGTYQDGELHGPWHSYWPNGAPQSRGAYWQGRRSGAWEFTHENGALAASGSYLLGLRDGRWLYFDAAGIKIEARCGLYRLVKRNHDLRVRAQFGETLDGEREGRWTTWWSNGALQSRATFQRGQRIGPIEFHWIDGSAAALDGGEAHGLDEPRAGVEGACAAEWAFAEELEPDAAPEVGVARIPRAPALSAATRARVREWIDELRRAADGDDVRKAALVLAQFGRDAVGDLLECAWSLDLEQPGEREFARRLIDGVLRDVVRGRPLGSGPAQRDAPVPDRAELARWMSWWELACDDEATWTALSRGDDLGRPLVTLELLERAHAPAVSSPADEERASPEDSANQESGETAPPPEESP